MRFFCGFVPPKNDQLSEALRSTTFEDVDASRHIHRARVVGYALLPVMAYELTVPHSGLLFASAFIILARYRSLPPQHAATRITDGGDFDPSNTGDAIELIDRGTGGTFGASIIRRG